MGYAADLDCSHQERERPDAHDDAHDTEHDRFENRLFPRGSTLPLRWHERLFGEEDQTRPKHGSSPSAQREGSFRRWARSGKRSVCELSRGCAGDWRTFYPRDATTPGPALPPVKWRTVE
jgi:hypothetical protein